MRQQDPAGAHTDALGLRADAGKQDFWAGVGKRRESVMLGKPEPFVPQTLSVDRQTAAIAQCLTCIAADGDRR